MSITNSLSSLAQNTQRKYDCVEKYAIALKIKIMAVVKKFGEKNECMEYYYDLYIQLKYGHSQLRT